jgi:DHA1 family multidrug resistance protein-like MFS transporter
VGYVTGPLIWAPGSEFIGRRPIFIGTFVVVVLFQIGEGLAKNIETLLICRFLSGVFAASPITNAGGVIADIWDPAGRGPAMAVVSVFARVLCSRKSL